MSQFSNLGPKQSDDIEEFGERHTPYLANTNPDEGRQTRLGCLRVPHFNFEAGVVSSRILVLSSSIGTQGNSHCIFFHQDSLIMCGVLFGILYRLCTGTRGQNKMFFSHLGCVRIFLAPSGRVRFFLSSVSVFIFMNVSPKISIFFMSFAYTSMEQKMIRVPQALVSRQAVIQSAFSLFRVTCWVTKIKEKFYSAE